VKLGQVLSIRPDVLPPKTMKELARLQDAAIRTKMEVDARSGQKSRQNSRKPRDFYEIL
jgi:predicted unusual protein kinase regulating ubiquinone biosynthesis (AarF/ABC1/UbiB family)